MPVVSGSRPGVLQSLIGLKTGPIRKGHNTEMLALKRNQNFTSMSVTHSIDGTSQHCNHRLWGGFINRNVRERKRYV